MKRVKIVLPCLRGKCSLKEEVGREDRAKRVFTQEMKQSIPIPCSGLGFDNGKKNPTKT